MNDITELVEHLKLSAESDKSYVYYDDKTGIPHKVSSRLTEQSNLSVIEVSSVDVKDLMLGKRRMTDFKVEYDAALKTLKIREVALNEHLVSVDDKLHQIGYDDCPDLKVTWNTETNCWTISLSKELMNDSYLTRSSSDVTLHFSITSRNDPNVLYKTVSIKVTDLAKRSYQFFYDPKVTKLSIYTLKYFQTYSFERV